MVLSSQVALLAKLGRWAVRVMMAPQAIEVQIPIYRVFNINQKLTNPRIKLELYDSKFSKSEIYLIFIIIVEHFRIRSVMPWWGFPGTKMATMLLRCVPVLRSQASSCCSRGYSRFRRVVVSRQKEKSIFFQLKTLKHSPIDRNSTNQYKRYSFKAGELNVAMTAEKKEFQRLPTDVCPYHYQIFLKPDIKSFTCEGEESVHVDVSYKSGVYFFYFHQLFSQFFCILFD